jgi:hypothetical protein
MNPNFHTQSVDGVGDRDDIALARDKQQGQIVENKEKERFETIEKIALAESFGDEFATPLSKIVEKMIESEVYSKLLIKQEVFMDFETISEALTEACIQLGLPDEEFSPSLHCTGHEVEICLY